MQTSQQFAIRAMGEESRYDTEHTQNAYLDGIHRSSRIAMASPAVSFLDP